MARESAGSCKNQWDGLVPGLQRGEYESRDQRFWKLQAERAEKINFSNPYFYSTLTHHTTGFDDTRVGAGSRSAGDSRFGVLKGEPLRSGYVQDLGKTSRFRSYDGTGAAI